MLQCQHYYCQVCACDHQSFDATEVNSCYSRTAFGVCDGGYNHYIQILFDFYTPNTIQLQEIYTHTDHTLMKPDIKHANTL